MHISIGPKPHLRFCACKTACLASELLVSMGSSPRLWFLDAQQRLWNGLTRLYGSQTSSVVLCIQKSDFRTRIVCLYGSQPSSVVYACKTATFGPEYKSLWVAVLTCRYVHAQQRDYHQNDQSQWVPALICGFCMQNSEYWTRITSVHGF